MCCEGHGVDAPVPFEVKSLVQQRLAELVMASKLRAVQAFDLNQAMLCAPNHVKAIETVRERLLRLSLGDRLYLETALIGGPLEAWSYNESQLVATRHHRLY